MQSTTVTAVITWVIGIITGILIMYNTDTTSLDDAPPTDDGIKYFSLPIAHEGQWICPYNP